MGKSSSSRKERIRWSSKNSRSTSGKQENVNQTNKQSNHPRDGSRRDLTTNKNQLNKTNQLNKQPTKTNKSTKQTNQLKQTNQSIQTKTNQPKLNKQSNNKPINYTGKTNQT